MISFQLGESRFNYRVAGIVLNGDRVLLHRSEMDDFWCLPGGRVEMLESAENALKREMYEELSVEVSVQRLVWIVENFFEYDAMPYHEIAFYFLMAFPPDFHLYRRSEPFEAYDSKIRLTFNWYRFDELDKLMLYPSFLQDRLGSISDNIEHIVHSD